MADSHNCFDDSFDDYQIALSWNTTNILIPGDTPVPRS